MSLLRLIPGYAQALAEEAERRDAAFFAEPLMVCRVSVRPLTVRDYLRLSRDRSPFVAGGVPTRADVAKLLWHQRWPGFQDGEETRRLFVESFDADPLESLAAEIGAFIDEALLDAPKPGTGGTAPYCSLGATLEHAFRPRYHMNETEVLDMRLDKAWQLLRCIQRDADPRAVLFNPSDAVKGQWLADNQPKPARADKPAEANP